MLNSNWFDEDNNDLNQPYAVINMLKKGLF